MEKFQKIPKNLENFKKFWKFSKIFEIFSNFPEFSGKFYHRYGIFGKFFSENVIGTGKFPGIFREILEIVIGLGKFSKNSEFFRIFLNFFEFSEFSENSWNFEFLEKFEFFEFLRIFKNFFEFSSKIREFFLIFREILGILWRKCLFSWKWPSFLWKMWFSMK